MPGSCEHLIRELPEFEQASLAGRVENYSSPIHRPTPIIHRIMQWNLQSNACDVLSLGPRTAGRLATVGITTVAELIAARPAVVAERLDATSIVAATLASWQREAELIVGLPELPPAAARLLAAVGLATAEQLRHSTPTEVLTAIETVQQENSTSWLAQTTLPSVTEVSLWIRIAADTQKSWAA